MPEDVNAIRNADFATGKVGPRNWLWKATSRRARWWRGLPGRPGTSSGMTIASEEAKSTALWSQIVVCKPGEHYRIEATATCDATAADDTAGFIIRVQPIKDERPTGRPLTTPGLHRATRPIAVRTQYKAPDEVRRLEIAVGLVDARGSACVHEVRFIPTLDPEEDSHVMAVPPPPFKVCPPRVARDVCICSIDTTDRPIRGILAEYFGDRHVHTLLPAQLGRSKLSADALLLPDAAPPSTVRSLAGLMKLAAERIVVISLPAFAKLSKGALNLRRVEQNDDPICAKVVYGDFATGGFALDDVLPYAWPGSVPGSFVQNQVRRTEEMKAFCDKHGLVSLLDSMCDRDVTSERPICLYKPTTRGGLFVLDIEPAEAIASTMGEPVLAVHLLLSMLGQSPASMGQYTVPAADGAEFRSTIREMTTRFTSFVVHDADVPAEDLTEQLVTIGGDDQSYGLPLRPKPVILVRSGLVSGDVESIHGAFLWFKQLIRMEPHTCSYAERLAGRFRLAWVPCAASYEAGYGWRPSGESPTAPMDLEIEDAEIAALIDIVARPVNQTRVIVPSGQGRYKRYATWLPRLASAFAPDRHFTLDPPEGEGFCNRDQITWHRAQHDVQVITDSAAFDTTAHRDVMAADGEVVRIEVPGGDANFPAHSIHRTDLTATLLEHVIGLQFGLVAMNRAAKPVHLDGFAPLNPGETLIVDRKDPILQLRASRAS